MLACIAACGSETAASTGPEADVTGSSWQKILDCDDGAAVVDVDTNERTHLQLVVRDPNAFATFDAMPYGEIKNARERIYRGQSPYGIFDTSAFRHLRAYEVAYDANHHLPGFEAIRDGAGLRFRSLDLSLSGCEPMSIASSPPDDAYPAACEVANYVFHACR
jgi:hypothetical protein